MGKQHVEICSFLLKEIGALSPPLGQTSRDLIACLSSDPVNPVHPVWFFLETFFDRINGMAEG